MYEESEKANEKCLCEFFESTFYDGSGLKKHVKKCNANGIRQLHIEILFNYNKDSYTKNLAALRLMATTVYGIEKFEALLDQESLVSHQYLFFK